MRWPRIHRVAPWTRAAQHPQGRRCPRRMRRVRWVIWREMGPTFGVGKNGKGRVYGRLCKDSPLQPGWYVFSQFSRDLVETGAMTPLTLTPPPLSALWRL
jgi:hypothetical protein